MDNEIVCPVCDSVCFPIDVVDFNKACCEKQGKFLRLSEIPIYYFFCGNCQFCLAPEFTNWEMLDFEERIYNDDYILVDPEYVDIRPRQNANDLISMFQEHRDKIRHLDFGGGNALLSKLLKEANFQSTSFDPFVDKNVKLESLGHFNLITAFEVFEHTPDVRGLIEDLSSLLTPDGVVLFSTLLSDGSITPGQRITWWYASPRNGHISLFSSKSLALLGAKKGFRLNHFNKGAHAYFREIPAWASHVLS